MEHRFSWNKCQISTFVILREGLGVYRLGMIVYDQNFYGGRMVDGEGGSSERCLKWSGGGWGSLRDLSKNILKQGVGKGENCS